MILTVKFMLTHKQWNSKEMLRKLYDPYTGSGIFYKLIMPQHNKHSLIAYAKVNA